MPASPGDKFRRLNTARRWNAVEEMLRRFQGGQLDPGELGFVDPYPPSAVWCKNISANDVTPGDVLGLGDPVITPTDDLQEFKARLAFEGSIPSTSTPHYGQYGIVQESCGKTDGFCRIVVAGLTFAKLNITHASDKYCEIANNVTTYLTTGALGSSRILWKSSGTGSSDKWGLIRVGEPSGEVLVKNTGSARTANSGPNDFAVITGTPHSESATGQVVSAYNIPAFGANKRGVVDIVQLGHAYAVPLE